jgi:hypothetical protein
MNTIKDALGIERDQKDKPIGQQVNEAASDDPQKSADARGALKDQAKEKAEHAKESIKDAAQSAKDKVSK